jgi:DNA-binding LacI/PurR family transcriptional regulator
MPVKRRRRTGSGTRRVTLSDVAKASGFSPSTVSIVLNEAPLSRHVAATTTVKIRETAERLRYRPDVFARLLRSQKSQTIGVLVIDLADPFCTLILRGIERKLRDTEYLPIIMDAHNEPQQVERYVDMMLERRVEGVLTVANWLFFDLSLLEDLSDRNLPTVLVGREVETPAISSVMVDNEAGGYTAIEHLYRLGHREIGIICGPRRLIDSRLRWKGMRRFAQKVGLRLNPVLIRNLPDISNSASSFDGSLDITREFLASGENFTALIAFDDISAFGAIRALQEKGLHVPQDCSVIGFDDSPAAALYTPSLTTVRQPMLQMGEYAAECILQWLQPGGQEAQSFLGQSHLMPAELVVRGSTAQEAAGGKQDR